MHKPHVTPLRFGMVALASLSFIAACGSDDDSSSEAPEATEVEEGGHEVVPAAEVTAGWTAMLESMTALSADPVSATDEALDEVHEQWESFEGTVKQEDPDAYLAAEEALDSFLEAGKDGNAVAMGEATTKMSDTATTYLAANPG